MTTIRVVLQAVWAALAWVWGASTSTLGKITGADLWAIVLDVLSVFGAVFGAVAWTGSEVAWLAGLAAAAITAIRAFVTKISSAQQMGELHAQMSQMRMRETMMARTPKAQ